MKAAIVTWQGGGASQPAIGIGRRLAERGHDVRLLGPAFFAARARVAGCRLCAFPREIEFDPTVLPVFEEQPDYAIELFFGAGVPQFVGAELEREPADVLVVDYLLRSTVCLAESRVVPTVLLVHMAYRQSALAIDDSTEPWSARWQYGLVNGMRESLGLEPLPVGPDPLSVALAKRVSRAIVAMPTELDPRPEIPENVIHAGLITEEVDGAGDWDSPWPSDDTRPLIVITMGTMNMRQHDVVQRAATAARSCGARVLVLTGLELAPSDVEVPSDVVVRGYEPHGAVLPQASLVVTHGGIGTLMASLAAGVPTICVPLGRDQHLNATRASELGASRTVPADADADAFERAIGEALGSAALAERAQALASIFAAYGDGARAVEAVEQASLRA
jgi:MGT family glycosyltransferase